MTVALSTIAVEELPAAARHDWAAGLRITLPTPILDALRGSRTVDWRETAHALRRVAAFTDRAPTSSRLPISYHAIPRVLRTIIAKAIGRARRAQESDWARYPIWPIDLSADLAADLAGEVSPLVGQSTPVLLSHDLDSPEGLRNALSLFAPIEAAVGAKAVHYVVPCAWPVDHGLVDALAAQGHEIGVHGYNHSNKTPFAPPAERERRLLAARPFIDRHGVVGYRAPSLLRTEPLLIALSRYYRYDSSVPTSGGLFPVPNNGCATARPFVLAGIRELPISLPRDGSLLFLGYKPEEILTLWKEVADLVSRSRGMVSLLTHCEAHFSGNEPMLTIYREFLQWLAADGRFRFMRPRDLVDSLESSA